MVGTENDFSVEKDESERFLDTQILLNNYEELKRILGEFRIW